MKVLQRYFAVSILQAVAFVLTALLALTAFMDLTTELPAVGKDGYLAQHAFMYVALLIPSHVFVAMPVAALLGTIYVMAQMAQSSEFTIMRASSMTTLHAVSMLFKIGAVLVVFTYIVGELIAPRTSPLADKIKLDAKGQAVSQALRSGMWTKDVVRSAGATGAVVGSRFINARQVRPDGSMVGVRIYEFDSSFRMHSLVTADTATFDGNNKWHLNAVTETLFSNTLPVAQQGGTNFGQEGTVVATRNLESMELVSGITPKIVSVAATDPDNMSANELAVYTRHLAENRQETDRFKIAFWKKLIDPFAIFVMMAMALPFAYMHTRSGGVSLKIFIGIMIGIGFILFNTLFSHLGMLSTWPPYITAVAPSLMFMLLAMGALWWVVRH